MDDTVTISKATAQTLTALAEVALAAAREKVWEVSYGVTRDAMEEGLRKFDAPMGELHVAIYGTTEDDGIPF